MARAGAASVWEIAPPHGDGGARTQKAAPRDRFIRFNFLKRKVGAGEEIRTLDPNLGKVVLYH